MMKRKIAAAAALSLVLGLTACTSDTSDSSSDSSNTADTSNAGADLFSIQTSVDYPGDIDELIDYASSEQEEDVRPELTSHIENLDDYDTVFIGYPLWWYDLPQVMYSFFDEYDFSGKTLIPFDVHNGSRLSDTVETIQELEPDAQVITDGFTISQSTVAEETESVAEEVSSWLQGLRN
ncbi:flavodoxin [Clostridium sp. AM29-11AC]|uniref:flavodoxin n=1 Tax=Clostridium sp. AM29-11AC TaxID=2293028 RepID=UPI001FA9519D|nr:flavodoxin [Clostridium sp. AM29-11AC]